MNSTSQISYLTKLNCKSLVLNRPRSNNQSKMLERHSNQILIRNWWLQLALAPSHLLQTHSWTSSLVPILQGTSLKTRDCATDKTENWTMPPISKERTEPVKPCFTSRSRRTNAPIKSNYSRKSCCMTIKWKASNSKKCLQRLPIKTRMRSFAESSPCERRATKAPFFLKVNRFILNANYEHK